MEGSFEIERAEDGKFYCLKCDQSGFVKAYSIQSHCRKCNLNGLFNSDITPSSNEMSISMSATVLNYFETYHLRKHGEYLVCLRCESLILGDLAAHLKRYHNETYSKGNEGQNFKSSIPSVGIGEPVIGA